MELGTSVLDTLPPAACHVLGNIMRRAPGGQFYLGWEQRWEYLDFAQIPVGVLSQAYEGYLREHAPVRQHKQGGYYTPRPIAEVLVRGAFHALRRDGSAHTAQVLDPAAGAGVFLITAFRQLVAEHWIHTGTRPNTETLREILYQQLTGFDIDEAALRFAALGLYLITIELDPQPEPVEKLRFAKNLRDQVLWKVGDVDSSDGNGRVGSLGSAVGDAHAGRYDLVVGNPPWTGAGRIPGWSEVTDNVTRIAQSRLGAHVPPPPIPNEVLDLPFLWRAMEWARPGGQIAMALHGRLLFQQGDRMPEARSAIFSALDITGVVNGSELRNTKVWPEVTAPFCLLFGKNRPPTPSSGFRFLSPRIETSLNKVGVMRLDPTNAEMVTARQVSERPTLLKTLFRGTRLDLELLERIETKELLTLNQYWRLLFGEIGNRTRHAGNGYQRLRESTKQPQSAQHLVGLPELSTDESIPILLNTGDLPLFNQPLVHRVRQRKTYRAPLVIVHESPPARTGRIAVTVSQMDVVFNESFYGYSSVGHAQAETLARYIALVLGSHFTLWHVLVLSGKFGFERDTIEKATIDSTPIVPIDQLGQGSRAKIDSLFDSLVAEETESRWNEVDAWVASIFGLRERDLQVIEDTLEYNLPFSRNRIAAECQPSPANTQKFCHTLTTELQPWGDGLGLIVTVTPVAELPSQCPWQILRLSASPSSLATAKSPSPDDWREITRIADRLGAAEILQPGSTGQCLWIGRLRQARYWSHSQAHLLAQRILWEHADILFNKDKV